MIILPSHKGGFFGSGGAPAWSPIDDANVLEVFNAWDESTHGYFAARTTVSYSTTAGVTTITCNQNPTGFSANSIGDEIIISTGDPEVDGEWTVASTSGATFTFSNPFGSTTVSPVSITGTVQWKHRKIETLTGMKGAYTLTTSLAEGPLWNNTTKQLMWIGPRVYAMTVPAALRTAVTTGTSARSLMMAYSRVDTTFARGLLGPWTGSRGIALDLSAASTIRAHLGPLNATISYTNAAVNNNSPKLVCIRGAAAERSIYFNDMVTAAASNALDGTASVEGVGPLIGRYLSNFFDGWINYIVFANGLLDETYRTNTKTYIQDNYGITFA